VRAVTRVAEPATEQMLLDQAVEMTASQLERVVRAWRRSDRVDDTTLAAKEQFEHWWDDDGMLVIRMRLGPEDGADFLSAVGARSETATRRDRAAAKRSADAGTSPVDDGDQKVADVRARATARRCAAVADLARAGRGVGRRPGDPPLREVVVHADAAVLADDAAAGRAYLEGGPALHPSRVRRMLCEATVVTMLERDREVLGVGRARRGSTRAQRRALLRRDGGCSRPGCTETRIERLHAHHMRHWLFGGGTDLDNLVLLCDVDHGLVHDDGLLMARREGRLVVLTPEGRRVWGAADAAFAGGLAGVPDATASTDDAFVGVQPIDELAARRPASGTRAGAGRGASTSVGPAAAGDLASLLSPGGQPDLPAGMHVNGERMDLDHVVWVLLHHRDLQRRLAAEARGRPLVAA